MTAETPLLLQWSYCSHALSHRFDIIRNTLPTSYVADVVETKQSERETVYIFHGIYSSCSQANQTFADIPGQVAVLILLPMWSRIDSSFDSGPQQSPNVVDRTTRDWLQPPIHSFMMMPWDGKYFPHYWLFVKGIHWTSMDSHHKGSVMWVSDVFFVDSLNKLEQTVKLTVILDVMVFIRCYCKVRLPNTKIQYIPKDMNMFV